MKGRLLSVVLAAMVLVSEASVCAAEETQKAPVFTVTPRVWLVYVNAGTDGLADTSVFSLPMYGLSIGVSPHQTPNWSFLMTGYHGTGRGDIIELGSSQNPGTADYGRFDVELLIRYTFPRTGLSLFGGPRYINWRRTQIIPDYSGTFSRLSSDNWASEFGVGYVSEIGDSGKHRIFGNFALGIDRLSWDVIQQIAPGVTVNSHGYDTQPGIDMNWGYEFIINKFASTSVRYRHFTMRQSGGPNFVKFGSYLGPEIGLSFRF